MIHIVLPPSFRPPSCPFVQRTTGVIKCLTSLGEPMLLHATEDRFDTKPGDLIFWTFPGYIRPVLKPKVLHIECGVGYDFPPITGVYRVYETEAWRHFCLGKNNEPLDRRRNSWVIPWAFDSSDWPLGNGAEEYITYLGRLDADKGLGDICDIARENPSIRFMIGSTDHKCGLDIFDPPSNVNFIGHVLSGDRARFLGNALCHLAPTQYVEPLGGTVIEAQLCGTPVITSNFGGFTETVLEGETGFRCNSTNEMSLAISKLHFNRRTIREKTIVRYGIEFITPTWQKALHQMRQLATESRI